MVINNGSGATNSRSLQMDHLKCCEPLADSIRFYHSGTGRGLRSPGFGSFIGVGVDKRGGQPSETAGAAPPPKPRSHQVGLYRLNHGDQAPATGPSQGDAAGSGQCGLSTGPEPSSLMSQGLCTCCSAQSTPSAWLSLFQHSDFGINANASREDSLGSILSFAYSFLTVILLLYHYLALFSPLLVIFSPPTGTQAPRIEN